MLFLDYNDVCRAPLAAAIYTELHGRPASSAGVYADAGAALCDAVRPRLLDGHTARQLTEDMLREANEVWCVTAAIARHLAEDYPAYAEKLHALEEIADPSGMGASAYQACEAELRRQLEGF